MSREAESDYKQSKPNVGGKTPKRKTVEEITLDLDQPACKIEFSLGGALRKLSL